jgi:hypothetical protein
MCTTEPLLSVAGLTVSMTAGLGSAVAEVRLLHLQQRHLARGALLSIIGGTVAARVTVLDVLSGRRAPSAGTLTRRVDDASVRQLAVSAETGTVLARSWSHLPGAARRGRLSAALYPETTPRLHFILADGAAPVDRAIVAQLVSAARAGDGLVLALPDAVGLPAAAMRGWRLESPTRVAALSMAS